METDRLVAPPALLPAVPPAAPESGFSGLLRDPRVRITRILNVLASDGVPRTVAWDDVQDGAETQCPSVARWDLTVTPHIEGGQLSSVRLELDRAPAPPLGTRPENWYIPEHRRAHTTVALHDQQTIVMGGFAESPSKERQAMLFVTPYIISDDADLRRLFQCKLSRAGATFPGPPVPR